MRKNLSIILKDINALIHLKKSLTKNSHNPKKSDMSDFLLEDYNSDYSYQKIILTL